MNTEIYYFTGTGNSLFAAKTIADNLNAKLISIASLRKSKKIKSEADVIGLVFPVYYSVNLGGVPLIVEDFLKRLEYSNYAYVFAVCTCGTSALSTVLNLKKIISSGGGILSSGFILKLPSNFIPVSPAKQKKILLKSVKKLEAISLAVSREKRGRFEVKGSKLIRALLKPVMNALRKSVIKNLNQFIGTEGLSIREIIPFLDRSFRTDWNCNGCGICTKVCPVRNVEIISGKPSWMHHCENCMACLHWCPRQAIHGGTQSDFYGYRYHNPEVGIEDIIKSGEDIRKSRFIVLNIPARLPDGRKERINPVLLIDNEKAFLIDTGFPGQAGLFVEAFMKAGVSLGMLTNIIITHHDADHIGSLSDIKMMSPLKTGVLAHEKEIPYIQGDIKPYKVSRLETYMDTLPEEKKPLIREMIKGIEKFSAGLDSHVHTALKSGDELPYFGGITVIPTPGHTPGHISLYLRRYKTLISGDALSTDGLKLFKMPMPDFLHDSQAAAESLKNLMAYDIETVICYHGGICRNEVNRQIRDLSCGS
jgi:glyoxylase-like metal-dependent hydrolase (beta-lactamase superfamily II)/ferredoxin